MRGGGNVREGDKREGEEEVGVVPSGPHGRGVGSTSCRLLRGG